MKYVNYESTKPNPIRKLNLRIKFKHDRNIFSKFLSFFIYFLILLMFNSMIYLYYRTDKPELLLLRVFCLFTNNNHAKYTYIRHQSRRYQPYDLRYSQRCYSFSCAGPNNCHFKPSKLKSDVFIEKIVTFVVVVFK